MPIIAKSTDDTLIDNIVLALQSFEVEQVAMDRNVRFNVKRDLIRPLSMRDMPLVNVWLESLNPTSEGSAIRAISNWTAKINIDCYTIGNEQEDETCIDNVATSRLYYLKEQVKHALYKLANYDFGMAVGVIGKKRWPSYQTFQVNMGQAETEVLAGRWSMDIDFAWCPEDIEGDALDQITVSTDIWSAKYVY